jgi:hypothetical protein
MSGILIDPDLQSEAIGFDFKIWRHLLANMHKSLLVCVVSSTWKNRINVVVHIDSPTYRAENDAFFAGQ